MSLREVVINAIVHNDYSLEYTPAFEVFDDRIMITSFGGLMPRMTVDDLMECYSVPRNRELMRVFKDLSLVERLGSGMRRILSEYDRSIFHITDNLFRVNLPFSEEASALPGVPMGLTREEVLDRVRTDTENGTVYGTVNAENGTVNNTVKTESDSASPIRLTKSERMILQALRLNSNATATLLREQLGLGDRTIKRAFVSLQKKGLLVRIGSDKSGHWQVVEHK